MATAHNLTLRRVGSSSQSLESRCSCLKRASDSSADRSAAGPYAGHMQQQRRSSNHRPLKHSATVQFCAQPSCFFPPFQNSKACRVGSKKLSSCLHSLSADRLPVGFDCTSMQRGIGLLTSGAEKRWLADLSRPLSNKGRRMEARAAKNQWTQEQSPYETLGVQGDAVEEDIKTAYRNLVKIYHPDVYTGSEDGEPEGARFIRIQAAYELLMDREARANYDRDHKKNPFMASEAWQAYVARKKKAFEQRGDVAASAWAEVQRHEMQVKARQLSKQKMDPEEERRLVAKELQIKAELFDKTSKRHMLVLKKRDLAKQRAGEDAKKLLVQKLLLEEGFELEDED